LKHAQAILAMWESIGDLLQVIKAETTIRDIKMALRKKEVQSNIADFFPRRT
jgi:hypothetical protein